MANKTVSLLFKRLLRLDLSGSAPPWPLTVWNDDTQTWDEIGIAIAPEGVLYERTDGILEFVLTSDGNIIGT